MKFCPQCGTSLSPEDRFCQECGFDSSSVQPEKATPEVHAEEPVNEVQPFIQPVVELPAQNFCPQCGTIIATGDRFCLECGFDTQSGQNDDHSRFKPVSQPQTLNKPEPSVPQTEPVTPPPPARKPEPVNPPRVTEPERMAAPVYTQPVSPQQPISPAKSKNRLVMIILVIAGVIVLGGGGWLLYSKIIAGPKETPAVATVNTEVPEVATTEPAAPATEVQQETTPEAASPAQTKSNSKPLSRVDQELAKYKAKEQNKNQQQPGTPAAQPATDPGVKITSTTSNVAYETKVLLEVGRKETPKSKKPKNPAKLTIQKPTMITRITTDHFNEGMGTSGGGSISIKDRDGNVLGTYNAYGKSGVDGAPNAKWVAEPRKLLDKGTYFIWDSDFSSWSKNFVGNAFIIVEGYEVK